MHVTCEPAILYFGTPVVILSTINEDGTANLAPMSSVFWLGWRAMLGLGASGQTAQNLKRSRECVLNLPSAAQVDGVNRLALTTGAYPVPEVKHARGYRHVKDKFAAADWTAVPSETVAAPRVLQCPVQMEASVEAIHGIADDDEAMRGRILTFEVRIRRVHIEQYLLADGQENRVDPDKWHPLIMSFQKFYGLQDSQLHPSTLAQIPEHMYRSKDVDRARGEWATIQEQAEALS
ncbi:MAG TPA: flavin reductase family protein [Burkholderiaceae bacterium]|jgi:flavin reductase (DIM6/NTAB) family NADH-FMN oxidoreductase RutF